mmetsp:Transcript_8754/g.15851  ORF Transcript_8754/g.15851 Transcript_8754/m.15851 type:complete len:82 (-) Transcript_8754:89-334(-)
MRPPRPERTSWAWGVRTGELCPGGIWGRGGILLLALLEELTEAEEWKLLPPPPPLLETADEEGSGGDIDLLMVEKSVRQID